MGNFISFQVKREPVSFEARRNFHLTGKRREDADVTTPNMFEIASEKLFEDVLKQRKEILKAQAKFQNVDYEKVLKMYPEWTPEHILDLKAQFQTFDMNQDALIDFPELCRLLDELGDTSDTQTRQQYFDELDSQSNDGAVDFEEYLAFIDAISKNQKQLNQAGKVAQAGVENASKIRKLSIVQQIEKGVF